MAEEAASGEQILVFEIGDLRCGIDSTRVDQIVQSVAITPLRTSLPFLSGVIDVRGVLVPVISLREKFGFQPREMHPDHHLILARCRAEVVALWVDRCDEVVAAEPLRLEPVLSGLAEAKDAAAVLRSRDGLVVIHDLDAFLTDAETDVLEEILRDVRRERPVG